MNVITTIQAAFSRYFWKGCTKKMLCADILMVNVCSNQGKLNESPGHAIPPALHDHSLVQLQCNAIIPLQRPLQGRCMPRGGFPG